MWYETRYNQNVGKGQGTISVGMKQGTARVWVKDEVQSECGLKKTRYNQNVGKRHGAARARMWIQFKAKAHG